jgi:hypothetical protein
MYTPRKEDETWKEKQKEIVENQKEDVPYCL